MNENEIRLNAENIRLMEENMFLREMLNRLIPIPINDELERLDYKVKQLNKEIKELKK